MSLPSRSVDRPIAVLMTTLAVCVFGSLSVRTLDVELLPDLSYPTLTVQTEYPDAAPESVEQFVTRPVEEAVGVIQGLRDMRSVSRAGLSEVVLEFEWDQEMDYAAMEVREKVNLVEMPDETEPARVLRFDPSLDPILRISLAGDRSLDELRQLAERWVKPKLESVRGVAAARVRGGLDPEVVVEADPERLAARGLALADLESALRSENVNRPGGIVKDWGAVYLIRTLNEFDDLEQLERTVIRDTAQGIVRVEDVATVQRGHRDRDEITRAAGHEAVELAIYREGSANTVAVADAVNLALDELRAESRADLELVLLSDQSRYIRAAIAEVWSSALLGGFLAVLVLFFFLRDIGATSIIALSIPTSVIATFLPLQQADVTINIMSLGGLALGVGMLVDNAIVVLEAIDRHRLGGLSRREAAQRGASEVAGAVTASTLTTVAVFLPIVFVEGIAGQLFYDLAVTICLSLLASLVVSLTVVPALAGLAPSAESARARRTLFAIDRHFEPGNPVPWTWRFLGLELAPVGDGVGRPSRALTIVLFPLRLVLLLAALVVGACWQVLSRTFFAIMWPASRGFEALSAAYPRWLRAALQRRVAVLATAFVLFAASVLWISQLGTDLVPVLAQGEFAFQMRLPEGTPIEATADIVERIEASLVSDPVFERVFSVVGNLPSTASGRQTTGENLAQISFVLAEGTTTEAETAAVERVRTRIADFPRLDIELVRPSILAVKPPIVVQLFSDDLDELTIAADRVVAALSADVQLRDLASSAEPGSPEIRIVPLRDQMAALGVTVADLAGSLRGQIRGNLVGQFREGEERLDIRLRVREENRDRATEVRALGIRLPGGRVVPVDAVAEIDTARSPAAIHRASGARMAEVTATTSGGDLGAVIDRVRHTVDEIDMPPGVVAELAGQDRELAVSFASLRMALALALFLVYVVMAFQFESILQPLIIMFAVPLALIGVAAALGSTGTTISVLALIGAVLLAGIVVNNAIVLVDAVNRRRGEEGQPMEDALVEAGRERLRPILMTTLTTVLGLVPMALGLGEGAELRAPLAITVIGGLTSATVLTLIIVPCLYRIVVRASSGAVPVAAAAAGSSLRASVEEAGA